MKLITSAPVSIARPLNALGKGQCLMEGTATDSLQLKSNLEVKIYFFQSSPRSNLYFLGNINYLFCYSSIVSHFAFSPVLPIYTNLVCTVYMQR